jgi:predicted nucleic acid-binding protein
MKPTLYLETTIPSYYTARPVRDVVALAHQEITRTWWDNRLPLFDVYISPVVLEEARQGAPEPAQRRLEVLATFPVLEATPAIEHLAATYMTQLVLPGKALRDAAHLAFACGYELDYLLTWNCAHIANAEIRRRLMAINAADGRQTPIICTPEELMGTEETPHV